MSRRIGTRLKFSTRACCSLQDFAGCGDLQRTIWGYTEPELYPLRLFVNLGRAGGLVLGAFTPGGDLIGFTAAMPAWRGKQRYYHSLSLGVLPGYQGQGVGKALKREQRRRALRAGIERIEWTFDPMRAKNALFNLEKLGAVVRHYVPDYYGAVESRLQQGLPSDRLICEWQLRSGRVRRAAKGLASHHGAGPPAAVVPIPPDFVAIAANQSTVARNLQAKVRRDLLRRLRRGLVITGFLLDGSSCAYLLDKESRAG